VAIISLREAGLRARLRRILTVNSQSQDSSGYGAKLCSSAGCGTVVEDGVVVL
jgi:hypothetical protein